MLFFGFLIKFFDSISKKHKTQYDLWRSITSLFIAYFILMRICNYVPIYFCIHFSFCFQIYLFVSNRIHLRTHTRTNKHFFSWLL